MAKIPDNDETGLMDSLDGVRKLQFDRVDLHRQKPRPKVRIPAPERTDQQVNKSALVIDETRENWFANDVSAKLKRRMKAGKLEIESTLDLHGMRQQQALEELAQFVDDALNAQLRLVLVIHGKGTRSETSAKLRPLVQRWLHDQAMVIGFCHAQPRHGGNGASYVLLRIL